MILIIIKTKLSVFSVVGIDEYLELIEKLKKHNIQYTAYID